MGLSPHPFYILSRRRQSGNSVYGFPSFVGNPKRGGKDGSMKLIIWES
jgi:hypothetical protein